MDAQMRNCVSRGLPDGVSSTAKAERTSPKIDEEQEAADASEEKTTIEGDHSVRSAASATKENGKSVLLLVDRGDVIARGTKTYDIREQLKALGFKWSSDTKSWFAPLDKEIVTRVEDEARQRNLRVDLQYVR